ncbi:hypothetical protein VNO77_17600 [Canavalia gladiata]|uniref:Uncharacterized protein n=1 Tax=Canavalia gladiata TaxID=3824 RepID=A0AAN9LN20_CANGL
MHVYVMEALMSQTNTSTSVPWNLLLGEPRSEALIYDSELYEIDYTGPETHSFVPPSDHSPGKSPSPHRKSSGDKPKTTNLRGSSGNKGKLGQLMGEKAFMSLLNALTMHMTFNLVDDWSGNLGSPSN